MGRETENEEGGAKTPAYRNASASIKTAKVKDTRPNRGISKGERRNKLG
ncbi:hypothetical protein cmbei_7005005 [Cryptosporidium meleagridis]